MKRPRISLLAGCLSGCLALGLAACGAPEADKGFVAEPAAADVKLPDSPVTLNIIDVAGNLHLTQQIFENYKAQHPKLVDKITYTKATSPELAGKVKAQQGAGRLDIDLVLTGTDGLSAGLEQGLWVDLAYAVVFGLLAWARFAGKDITS